VRCPRPSHRTLLTLGRNAESLHLTHLSHLILDVSHCHIKKRSLVNLPEACADLFKLLGSKPIMDSLGEGKMKIVVF
jgi:protein CMS1